MFIPLLVLLLSAMVHAQETPPADGIISIDNRIIAGMTAGAAVVEDYPVFLNRELLFYRNDPFLPLPFLAQPDRVLSAGTEGRIIAIQGGEVTYSKDDPDSLDRYRVYVAFDPACDKLACAYVFGRPFVDKFRYGFRREFVSTLYSLAYLPDADHELGWNLFASGSSLSMKKLERKEGVLRANDLEDGVRLVVRAADIQPILGVLPSEEEPTDPDTDTDLTRR